MKINTKDIIKAYHEGIGFSEPTQKVIIIGAGAAGLAAAHFLTKSGVECVLLEASERVGGRVYSREDLGTTPLELGAEEIHGEESAWFWLLQTHNFEILEYTHENEDLYFVDEKLLPEALLEQRIDYQNAYNYWDYLQEYQSKQPLAFHIWLKKQQSLFGAMSPFVKAWVENAYGTQAALLNVPDMVKVGNTWNSGETNFVLEKSSYQSALQKIFSAVLPLVQLGKIIHQIDYQNQEITLTSTQGETWKADKVLITIPLTQLQKQAINFQPTLPPAKQRAIESLQLGNVMKLILRFKESFWKENTGAIYPNALISEFYTSAKDNTPQLTAYISGQAYQTLSKLTEAEVLAQALDILSKIYQQPIAPLYDTHLLIDWKKEPFIEGAYSFPHIHAERYRSLLANPIDEKVFFAGEATNYHGHAGTVHGAVESAYRAVQEMS